MSQGRWGCRSTHGEARVLRGPGLSPALVPGRPRGCQLCVRQPRKIGHSTLSPVPGPVRASQHPHQHGPKSDSLRVSPEFESLFGHGEEVKAAYICRKPRCPCREAAGMDRNEGVAYEDGRHPLQSPWAPLTLPAPGASALCSRSAREQCPEGNVCPPAPCPSQRRSATAKAAARASPTVQAPRQGTRGVPGRGAHFSPFVRVQSMPVWRPAVVERTTVISVCKQGV